MIPRTITNRWLQSQGACADQRKLFREVFPEGMPVTLPNLRRAAKSGLEIAWLGDHLSAPAWKVCNEALAQARRVYNEAIARAWKVCNEALAQARRVYNEASAQAWWVCNEAIAPAWKVCNEALAQARRVYNEAIARALMAAIRADWKGAK